MRQQNYFDKLLEALEPANLDDIESQRHLVEQVVCHYKEYFELKSEVQKHEVFLFFSPPWFNPFERSVLWVGGWKASLIFTLLYQSVEDLTPEQEISIERLEYETKREERELTEEMARLHESVATAPLQSLARRFGRLIDGEVNELEAALEKLKSGLRAALERGDSLRISTTIKVMEVVDSLQSVKLLAALAQFHLGVRRLGTERRGY